jgi:hypothetical protein
MENLKRHLEYKEDFLLFAKNEANILTPFGLKKSSCIIFNWIY